jgi:hypothetical protein
LKSKSSPWKQIFLLEDSKGKDKLVVVYDAQDLVHSELLLLRRNVYEEMYVEIICGLRDAVRGENV